MKEPKTEPQKPQPKFLKHLQPNKTTLLLGEQLLIETELDLPPTTVQLLLNGEILPQHRVKTNVTHNKIKFTLDNIQLNESGDFTVNVNDEIESKPLSIKVNIDIPKFVKNLSINKKNFDVGETLVFECTLNKPFNEIVWLKDNEPIEEDAHIQFLTDGPKLKMIIKDAQPSDHTGTYSVRVKDVESDKVPVTVTKKVPKFIKELKANKTTLIEGEQLVLECELDTTPDNVELKLNGEPVSEDRVKADVKDNKIKFTLDNIQLNESGDFTVNVNDEIESKPLSIKVNIDIPKFVKNLSINKKNFDVGETVVFECTLNKPFNEIVWLKDNEPIEEDAHIQFLTDGPKLKIIIKDAQPSDHTGTYSVRVKDVESDKVPVTVTKKVPKFIKDLKANKTTLIEGEQLVLECELDTTPDNVELKLNGEPVSEDRVKADVKDNKIKFTLDNIQLNESGDFTVNVNDEIESKPLSIKVNIDIPKFVKNLSINKKNFDVGETLVFECTLNKPFNEIVWLKDNEPIEEDAHIQFLTDGPKLKMIIKDAQPSDHTGTYSVRVKDVESDKVPVTVTKKVPKFIKELKANKTTLIEGEQLVLECELDTTPDNVELKLNGEPVSEDRVKADVKDNKIKFTLDNIQLNESGDFTVNVNDEIESKPLSIKVNIDIPKFVKNLSINKKNFDVGETLVFECTLNKPFNEIVWLKDNEPIEEDAHIQFLTDGPKLKMIIKDAQPSDHTGTYSVRVKDVESDKVPVTVTKKVPKFIKELKANKTTLIEGEQLVLECELDTTPDNVELKLNGEPVSEDRVKADVKDNKIKFTLDNIQLNESGDFTVNVNDEIESKPLSIKVNIDIPKFVKNLSINKKNFDVGETLVFECTLNKPFNEIVWLKDNEPIEEDAHIQFLTDGPKLKMIIKDAQPSDHTGTYSVRVKDVESDKVPVTVTKKVPKFIKELKANKTTLIEGEQLVLECELDTTPDNVELKLNGEPVSEDRVKADVKDNKIKFTLDNIQLNESGDFTVNVNDEIESKPLSIKVNIDIPKFVKNLSINKKNFDVGETLVFECTLNKPFNEIVWLKDNEPIEEDAHIQFLTDGPKLKMIIKDAQPSDHTGTYSVRVKDVESDKVPVTVTKKVPKFIKELKANKTTLIEGEQLVLECELDTTPDNVELKLNGEPVSEDRVKADVKDNKIKFTLDNIQLNESGDFTVNVNDEIESKPLSIKVNIDIPKFVKNLSINKKNFDVGETLVFECTLNKPFNEIVWLKDNEPIEEDAHIQFLTDGPKLKMIIKDAQPSDHTGTYSVRVKDVESDKVPVTVTKKVPKFIKELKANKTTLIEGEQLVLECELDTTPDNVELKLNGEPVSEDRVKADVKDNKIKFTLDNIQLNESGDFTVNVNDEIESKPLSIKVNIDIPKFVKNLSINKKNFDVGETLVFECTLNKPFNEIVWLKDNEPIEEDAHIQFLTDGPKLKMIIKDAQPSDHTGTYSVRVKDVESDKVPVTVTKKVPKFIKELKANKTTLIEGEQLVLECELDTTPDNVELKLNGEPVSEDRVKADVKDNKIKFTLDNIQLNESGDFTVNVNDEIESKPLSIKVNIDIPKFVKNLSINKKNFDVGETLVFECTLNKPFNEIVWLKDNEPIEEDAHIQFLTDGPKLKMIIKDAQPSDHTGTYSVRVKDVESDKVPVTVTKKVPKFIKELKANKTTLIEGEQLVLECELDTTPDNVELKLNGEPVSEDRVKADVKDNKIKFTLDNIQLNESGDFTVNVNDEIESKPLSIKVNIDIPKFVKNLSINKKNFDVGETLVFECTLNKPFNEIVWLKDNEPIEEDAHIQFLTDGPKLKMIIKDAQPSDHTGTYSVQVKDLESDRVPAVVQEKPLRFVRDLEATKTSLNEGETLEFRCQLNRPLKSDETIEWRRNEIEVPIEREYPDEHIDMQIADVEPTMSGSYCLEVSGPDRRQKLKSSSVKVTVKPEEIKFIKPLRALNNPLKVDETLVLECELDKPNYKSVVFSLNDKPLNEIDDDRIEITQTGNKWQVQIQNVKEEADAGEYMVTVNEKVSSPKVKVMILKPFTFVEDLTVSNSDPIVDETITFQCELSNPLPTGDSKDVSFTLNGKSLTHDQTKRLKIQLNSTSPKITLTLSNIKLNVDQGDYQLKILHPQALQSQTVNVVVKPKLIEVIQPLQSDKSNISEEDTIVLSTKLKNVPENPTIVWLQDNEPISIDNKRMRSTPSRDGQQYKLSIEDIQLNQSGTYALQINEEIITQCDVTVKSIPLKTVQPLKVIGKPIVEENVELQMELNRPNIPFVWYKDNNPLENQPTLVKDQTKYRLKLSKLKLDDTGIYSISFNEGELEEKVNLNVALPPFEFLEQLKCVPTDDVEEESDVMMQCVLNRSIDDENIPVTILKNNRPLPTTDKKRVKIEREGPTLKIHLSNVKSDDAGQYLY